MFTGLVDHVGKILEIKSYSQSLRILIQTQFEDLKEGESISVDGICLTALRPEPGKFFMDLSPETLRLTTAENWELGGRVNLERALRLSDRLGGHIVLGHVDQVATVLSRNEKAEFIECIFGDLKEPELIVQKGCIAINGVSLTVNQKQENTFSVMLIPHTLERTQLSELKPGKKVNIEYDYLARLIKEKYASFNH